MSTPTETAPARRNAAAMVEAIYKRLCNIHYLAVRINGAFSQEPPEKSDSVPPKPTGLLDALDLAEGQAARIERTLEGANAKLGGGGRLDGEARPETRQTDGPETLQEDRAPRFTGPSASRENPARPVPVQGGIPPRDDKRGTVNMLFLQYLRLPREQQQELANLLTGPGQP